MYMHMYINACINVCLYLYTGLVTYPSEPEVPNFSSPSKPSSSSCISNQRYKQELLNSTKFPCYNTPAYRTLHQNVRKLLATQQTEIQKRDKFKLNKYSNDNRNENVLDRGHIEKPLIETILEVSKIEIDEKQAHIDAQEAEKATDVVIHSISLDILEAFNQFFTEIFFHAIPPSILYYPSQVTLTLTLTLTLTNPIGSICKNMDLYLYFIRP
jgi:hypothetical protein